MLSWSKFIWTFCLAAAFSAAFFYLVIVLVDPYDSVPFSLPLEREPVSTNQRFAYPSLARKQAFDSAVIGTSTARLLKPERLNQLSGNNWVNLAMNSATAYEQMEMLKLFLRHHPEAKHIVIGIDDAWCRPAKEIQQFTFRPFPPWMYDDNRWNDLLYVFNDKSLENTVRLIEYWLGKREAKYDRTGYRDFTDDFGKYDDAVARVRLYPDGDEDSNREFQALAPIPPDTATVGKYPNHDLLARVLSSSHGARKISILFMPMHGHYLRRGADNYRACKGSLLDTIDGEEQVEIIDRMHIDQMTNEDRHYWDPLHYTTEVARVLEQEISK